MEINKATHKEYTTELFMPIMKDAEGKYIAVLSDTSVDRDDERLSKSCVEKLGNDDGYLAALLNHDNDIMNLVAEWTNKGIRDIDGHTALIAEPKFYTANPKAKIIKGMLDQGAKPGVSIGAIVKDYDDVNNKRVFKELELVEASFVAIPSNKHGRALAVAKSFNTNKKGGIQMEKEFTQKDVDSQIEKKVEEMKTDFNKQLESKETEIVKLKDDLEKSVEDAKTKTEEAEKSFKEQLEQVNKKALEKQNIADAAVKKDKPEDLEKGFESGKLPIMHM